MTLKFGWSCLLSATSFWNRFTAPARDVMKAQAQGRQPSQGNVPEKVQLTVWYVLPKRFCVSQTKN